MLMKGNYAPEPGPRGGRCIYGGANIISGINSFCGCCVCAPRLYIQISLFSILRFSWYIITFPYNCDISGNPICI